MRIRRIRVSFLIIIIFLVGCFLCFLLKSYQNSESENERQNLSKEKKRAVKNDNAIISKSVLLGYSNSDNLTIFSAYRSKLKDENQVYVILSSYGYLNRQIYCRLFDEHKNEVFEQATVVFPEYTVKCDSVPNSKFVAVSVNKKDPIDSMMPISENDSLQKSEFTVCLAPIFGNSPKVLMIMEFVEYYKIQGADKFLVYLYEESLEVRKILGFYKNQMGASKFETVKTGNDTKCLKRHRCRHEMQLQDCIYRSRNTSKWVATVDLDERIMPMNEKLSILNLLRQTKFSNSNFGELRFRCQWTLRYAETSHDDQLTVDDSPMLIWHNTSHVAPQNHTTKSIVRPERVDSMGVHGVQKFTSQEYTVALIEPDEAVVRHYRLIEGWSFFLKEAESFGKFWNFTLSSNLEQQIRERLGSTIEEYKSF